MIRRPLVLGGGGPLELPTGDVAQAGLPFTFQSASTTLVPGAWFGFPGGLTATLPAATAALAAAGAVCQLSWDALGAGPLTLVTTTGDTIQTASGSVTSSSTFLLGEVVTLQAVAPGVWRAPSSHKGLSALDGRYASINTVSAPPWAASATYRVGDLVWQAATLYRRNTAGTSGATFDAAMWDTVGPSASGGGADTSGRNSRLQLPLPRVGDWIMQHAANIGSQAWSNGELEAGFLWLPGGTYDAVGFQVDVAGSAGALVKPVLYSDNNGRPGSVLLDGATVDATTNGFKSVTGLSLVIPAGGANMWAGTVTQGAPTTLPKIWKVTLTAHPQVSSSSTPPLTLVNSLCYVTTGITGAAPTTWSSASTFNDHSRLAFRRSA